jgi:MraZ protein
MGNNGSMDKYPSGEYEVTLDEAGRIAIPRYLRLILEKDHVVLTKGADPCLWLYTAEAWKERLKTIVDTTDPDSARGRDIRRRYIGPAHPLDMDKQGRILIAPPLREFAGLSRECMVVGQHNYIEIWDKERYKAYECSQAKYEERSETFAKEKKELSNNGNSTHAGIVGGSGAISRSEERE